VSASRFIRTPLPAEGVGVLFGPAGAFKSFLSKEAKVRKRSVREAITGRNEDIDAAFDSLRERGLLDDRRGAHSGGGTLGHIWARGTYRALCPTPPLKGRARGRAGGTSGACSRMGTSGHASGRRSRPGPVTIPGNGATQTALGGPPTTLVRAVASACCRRPDGRLDPYLARSRGHPHLPPPGSGRPLAHRRTARQRTAAHPAACGPIAGVGRLGSSAMDAQPPSTVRSSYSAG
jgi:hypothetical protein